MCRPYKPWYTDAPAKPQAAELLRDWIGAVIEHPFVKHVVSGAARCLCPRPRFNREDRKDMEQEMWTALVKGLPSFDPHRHVHLFWFLQVAVMNAAKKIWRLRDAKKRQHRRVPLPDEIVDWKGATRLGDEDLRLDMQHVLTRLPRYCRMLACYLAGGWGLANTAKEPRQNKLPNLALSRDSC